VTLLRRVLLAALPVLALGGCGDAARSGAADDAPATTTTAATTAPPAPETTPTLTPKTTAPAATTSAPAPTTPSTPAAADPGGASADGAEAGDAGDEEPIRQPARFTLAGGDVTPASVSVAPFLAVALTVVGDGSAHTVKLVGTDVAFAVPASGRVERRLPGLKAGVYTLSVDGRRTAASLVVGDNAGP
jgi:hypothetical protein